MRLFLSFTFLASVLIACAPLKITSSNDNNTEIYGPGVLQLPVVAELKVDDQKVSTTIQPPKGTSIAEAKTIAIREILKKTGGDILVQPTVEYEIFKRKITMTATGYSAKYINFHQLTPEEVPLFEAGILQKPKVDTPVLTQRNKRTARNVALGTVGLAGAGGLTFLLLILFG